MAKKPSFADAMFAELNAVASASGQPLTRSQIDAGVRSVVRKTKDGPSIARKRPRFAAPVSRSIGQGALTASPEGTLTQKAADFIGRMTGDSRASHRAANSLGTAMEWSPMAALNTGQSLRNFTDSPNWSDGVDTALGALDFNPVTKAAGNLASIGLPMLKKGVSKATRRSATAADFDPANIRSINDLDNWSIFTAENPMGKQASPEANAKAMAALRADLAAGGHTVIDGGVGKYGNHENVLTVLDIPEAQARKLGKKYNQDSVLTNKGLIYQDGSMHKARGVNTFDEAPDDFYTELPNGSKFAVDIDFDKLIPAKPDPRPAVLSRYADGGQVETDTLHSPYSKIKMQKTHAEQRAEIEQTHQFSEAPVMRPEDFKLGSHIVPLVGDRSAAGRSLVGVDGRKLSEPLPLEGGARYPHYQADMGQDGAWASGSMVTKAIDNNVRKVANGNDVHGVYSAMGPRSVDFSTMMSDALLRQLPEAPIPKGVLSQFDAQMRKDHPRFAGISDPSRGDELRAQLLAKGSLRLDFVKAMDDAKRQAAGFPDVAATRYAITDPALRHAPEGTTGMTIAKMDTQNSPILNPAIPHTSYPSQVRGAFSGGFETPLSREEVFPDFFAGRRALGVGTGGDRRSFEISSVNQPVTQHWVDSVSEAIERKKAMGQGW